MSYETIETDLRDSILIITLNRPDSMNAFNRPMVMDVIHALDEADANDAVRAVIFTGAGRAYSAGADLSAGTKTFDYDKRKDERDYAETPVRADGTIDFSHPAVRDGGGMLALRIFQCLKPVIGAINGAAAGLGVTMTLPMDIRIASTSAKFGFVFARRGIVPEAASSWFLPRIVGISRAMEWCATGRIFLPDEAKDAGLIRSIHPPEDLLPAARTLAREIADNTAPVSVAVIRQMLWRGLGQSHPMEAHRLDSRMVYERGRSADAKEGIASFLEKRTPEYPNRVSCDMPVNFPWWIEPEYE